MAKTISQKKKKKTLNFGDFFFRKKQNSIVKSPEKLSQNILLSFSFFAFWQNFAKENTKTCFLNGKSYEKNFLSNLAIIFFNLKFLKIKIKFKKNPTCVISSEPDEDQDFKVVSSVPVFTIYLLTSTY